MQIGRGLRFAQAARLLHTPRVNTFSTLAPAAAAQRSHASLSGMLVVATGSLLLLSSETKKTYNHCQVPCGIFDDPAIVSEIKQACTTIRKAIVQSKMLHEKSGSDPLALNQMVRWINTKEEHCSKIITLIAEYCLCQRIKRPEFKTEADYLQALKIHHNVMQAAMKAKQSMNEAACDALEHAVDDLAKMYTK